MNRVRWEYVVGSVQNLNLWPERDWPSMQVRQGYLWTERALEWGCGDGCSLAHLDPRGVLYMLWLNF